MSGLARTFRSTGALLLLVASCARGAEVWRQEIGDPETDAFDRGLAAIALAQEQENGLDGVPAALLSTLDLRESALQSAAVDSLLELPPTGLGELARCFAEASPRSEFAQRTLEAALVRHGAASVPPLLDAMPEVGTPGALPFGRIVTAIGEPAVAPLAEVLSPGQRGAKAAFLLGSLGRRSAPALDALLLAAGDADRALALAAIDAVSRVNPEGWRIEAALRDLSNVPDPERRAAAEEGLGRILLERGRKLDPATSAKKRLGLLRAAVALGPDSADAFVEGLWPEGSRAASFAADALLGQALRWSVETRSTRGTAEEIRTLAQRIGGGPLRERRAAALAVGRAGRGGAEAIPALERALENQDHGLRFCAQLALALIAIDVARGRAE